MNPDELANRIAQQDARRKKAQGERRGSLWAHVARVGSLGWMIALPIAGGALLGHAIDRWLGTGITWSLALLTVGLAAGGYALWSEVRKVG